MARIRTIKPEFWTDSFMVQLPPLARLLYIGLWTAADDHGCIPDEPERLAMELMPKEDSSEIDGYIQLFVATGRLDMWVSEDGETFLRVAKWETHQKVDRPSKSRFPRESSRKLAIPLSIRRALAEKYGCEPGTSKEAECFYCGAPGHIHWQRLYSGKPGSWVYFSGLEIDHLEPEHEGGETTVENLVLACRSCNRSKGTKAWFDALSSRSLAIPRDPSRRLVDGKEGKGKERKQASLADGENPRGHAALTVQPPTPSRPMPPEPEHRSEAKPDPVKIGRDALRAAGADPDAFEANGGTYATVQRWLSEGLTPEEITAVFRKRPDVAGKRNPVAYAAKLMGDEIATMRAQAKADETPPPQTWGGKTEAEWETRITIGAEAGWSDCWGDPPGDPGSLCPKHLWPKWTAAHQGSAA